MRQSNQLLRAEVPNLKKEVESAQGQKGIAIGQDRITAEMPTRLIVLAKEEITKS